MYSKMIGQAIVLGGLSMFGLQGCATGSYTKLTTQCSPSTASTSCLLQNANLTLDGIQGNFNWVSSATELAIAMEANGEPDLAWSLLAKAANRVDVIEDVTQRNAAISELSLAIKVMEPNLSALRILDTLENQIVTDVASTQADLMGRITTARGVHGSIEDAENYALAMGTADVLSSGYRGRTLREITKLYAKHGNFEHAIELSKSINGDFTYYHAIALTDIMAVAAKSGRRDILDELSKEAEAIAVSQENGYFSAGIFRDLGFAYLRLNEDVTGLEYIEKARAAAKAAPQLQEKARSTSRIATRLADTGNVSLPIKNLEREILRDALKFANEELSEDMQNHAFYEIAGSAAFVGEFEMANELIEMLPEKPFGSTESLRAVSKRDLAWGLARAGRMEDALRVANSIAFPREKVQTLSCIVRLQLNPEMEALPRYL